MIKKPLSRRTLLKSAAGFSVALPWLEAMAATPPPRRVIFVFTANGDQTARRLTTKTETGFVFDDMLSPFEPYRQNMLVMEGINKYHYKLPDGARADGHEQGGSALAPWKSGTGSFPIGGGNGATIGYVLGPSADYAIGERVVKENPSVRFKHLNFRVGQNYNNIWNQHAHAGPVGTQNPVPPQVNPFTAYTQIFSGLDLSGQATLARRLALKQSALDLVNGDLNSLRGKLPAGDRARLEQHADSIRDLERALQGMAGSSAACKPLGLPATFDHLNDDNYAKVGDLFFKISNLAFSCDLVRTINFNWSGNTNDRVYGPELGLTDGHHTISHNSDTTSFDHIRAIKKQLFTHTTTKLFDLLKATPEADKTMWDYSLVVIWSELSQGDTHATDNDLVLFAGGAHGHFRQNRYLNFKSVAKNSHSNMVLSVWDYMGYGDVTTWGDPLLLPNGGGPLPGLV
ncbi:MAG: DUF1552 domain-containing protein [Myxococcaceae bacterium]|nr:DUF1552 domain-containing protein [Myxococcaceae bacterium]